MFQQKGKQDTKGKPSYFDFFSNACSHYVNQSKQHVHMMDSYVVKQPSQTSQEHNSVGKHCTENLESYKTHAKPYPMWYTSMGSKCAT